MNEDNKAINTLSREIIKAVKATCKNLPFDKTYEGIISVVNSDGYTVEYNGTSINVKTIATDLYKVGDMVKVCIPCGNNRRAYIVVDVDSMKRYVDEILAKN